MDTNIAVATYHFRGSFEESFKKECSILTHFFWERNHVKPTQLIFNKEAFDKAKLIIFTGGEDINPKIYNQKNKYSNYNNLRDEAEITVLKVALETNKKILGVCRGHQLVNAYLGGSLVQDINKELGEYHSEHHELFNLGNSKIGSLFPGGVNSMHHQGVLNPGVGLIPTSFYGGVYESCESDQIITVQWHPEFMPEYSNKFFEFIKEWANL